MLLIAVTLLATVFALLLAGVGLRRRKSRLPLPPGPSGYPIIGNALDKVGPFDWRLFSKHRAQWGDMTSVTILGQTIVTLHTYEKAVEVLEKKSDIHCSRPVLQFFFLGGWENDVVFAPYGQKLRKSRTMISQELSKKKIGEFNPHQEFTARRFLRVLLKSPEQFYDRVNWYLSTIMLKVVYGYDTLDEEDPMVGYMNDALSIVNNASSPGQILEVLPWLRYIPAWFPGAGFKRQALESRVRVARLTEEPFKHGAKTLGSGESNYVTKRLPKANSPAALDLLKNSAMSFMAAGVETTSTTLRTFFFIMQAYPSVQREAQEEIDAVIGRGRLPSFNDRTQLPYVNALFKELLRFHPPAPSGIQHKSIADDVHDGYYLPKGTVTITSLWEMSHDPTVYSDPDTFNPSRFLGPQPERDPAQYIFGFGRRACPAVNLVEQTVFMITSNVLATFDISPFDSKNKEEFKSAPGFSNRPLPFKCRITPRTGVDVEELTTQR